VRHEAHEDPEDIFVCSLPAPRAFVVALCVRRRSKPDGDVVAGRYGNVTLSNTAVASDPSA
jgi:hypothetical protein